MTPDFKSEINPEKPLRPKVKAAPPQGWSEVEAADGYMPRKRKEARTRKTVEVYGDTWYSVKLTRVEERIVGGYGFQFKELEVAVLVGGKSVGSRSVVEHQPVSEDDWIHRAVSCILTDIKMNVEGALFV